MKKNFKLEADALVMELQRKIFSRLIIYYAVAALGIAGFIVGGVFIIKKLVGGGDGFLWTVPAVVLVALVVALLKTMRQMPSADKLMIWLDSQNHAASGWLSTANEVDVSAWRSSIKLPEIPKVVLQKKSRLLPLTAGIIFAVGGSLIPVKQMTAIRNNNLDITTELNTLTEKLEVIKSEQLATPEQIEKFEQTIEEIIQKNDASDSARTYDNIEKLDRKLDRLGENAAMAADKKIEKMSMLQELTEKMAQNGMNYSADDIAKANEQLNALMNFLAQDDPELAEALRELAEKLGAEAMNQMLDPEMLKQLSQMSAQDIEKLKQMVEKLRKAKLAKSNCQNGSCKKPGTCKGGTNCDGDGNGNGNGDGDGEALAAWLEANSVSSGEGCDMLMMMANCNALGSGAVSRGRGDAPLNMTGDTKESDAERKLIDLSQDIDPSQSIKISQSSMRPDNAEDEQAASVAGALSSDGSVRDQRNTTLHPAHRQSVKRYMNQFSKSDKESQK